jgi:hypothetical protein
MNKINLGSLKIAVGTAMVLPLAALISPIDAVAQSAPTSCNDVLQNCPLDRTPNLTQVQIAPVLSTITINGQTITVNPPPTDGSPAEVTATAITSSSTGIGNNISASSSNGVLLDLVSTQDLSASVGAVNDITTTAAVPGVILATTTAYGNTAQAQTCCGGMDVIADQSISAAAGTVSANGILNTAPGVGTLSMTTSAVSNVVGAAAINGAVSLVTNQNNDAGLNATSTAVMCCNNDSASISATATSNSSQSSSASSTVYSWAAQNNRGAIDATAMLSVNSGTAISSAAQATANVASAYNNWGYTELSTAQHAEGPVSSHAILTANNFVSSATAGTTSQGNLAILSGMGSDGRINAYQNITATSDVIAVTDWSGFSQGGVGTAIASASGNGLTGFVCTICGQAGVGLYGNVEQLNGGNVSATVNMSGGTSASIVASATAVGNSANFITQAGAN